MIAIPLLQYYMDVKSNIALGAAIVSFFDGTSCVCQWGGVSDLRHVVDELKRTNQEGPRRSSTKSAKRAAEHGIAATVSK